MWYTKIKTFFEENLFDWLVIILVVILIIIIIYFIIKKFILYLKNKKEVSNFKSIILNKEKKIVSISMELKMGILTFKKRFNHEKEIAWFALIEMLTTVIGNKYDTNYGNAKEALTSMRNSYRKLRNKIQEYPEAYKSNAIILKLINNEIRPFITEWNFKFNDYKNIINDESQEKERIIKLEESFIKEYNKLYENIKNEQYIEKLSDCINIKIKYKEIVMENGVEEYKKDKSA